MERLHIMQASQTTLAKLLAKENIEIQHGNFTTAWFDVDQRVLGLPVWKDRGKDVYSLLVGHEVGHALFTPAAGWHESTTDIPGIPRSYVNVVEDVRIEKLVQRMYPGLVSVFKRGYKTLVSENFFGTEDRNLDSLSLVDKINLKAKARDLIDVSYSEEEQPIVDIVMAVETWDDVIEACKALYEFMKQEQEDQPKEDQSVPSSFDDEEPTSSSSSDEKTPTVDDDEESEEEVDEESPSNETVDDEESKEEESKEESVLYDNVEQVLTDEAFRNNEHKLIDTDSDGNQPIVTNGISRAQCKDIVIPYSELKAKRISSRTFNEAYDLDLNRKKVNAFEAEIKPIVATMAKEFEMRKAAFRLQRASSSRSGAINVNKLHSYKYNDDIFARVTNLADAKSHGMIMFVDYSGSMASVIGKVLRQTITLVDFCKKVNIPFSVYGFTTRSRSRGDYDCSSFGGTNYIYSGDVGVFETISSSLSRSDYKQARDILIRQSFQFSCGYGYTDLMARDVEGLGATPLFETILCSEYIIKDFKAKHGVQKINTVFLTDGSGDMFTVVKSGNLCPEGLLAETSRSWGKLAVKMNGKFVKCSHRRYLGKELMNELRNIEGVTTIGFFMCEQAYEFKQQLFPMGVQDLADTTAARKQYTSQKFFTKKDVLGYDQYFVLNGKNWKTETEEFSVDQNATKAQITSAFKKHTSSKKGNKVLATQFAKLIA